MELLYKIINLIKRLFSMFKPDVIDGPVDISSGADEPAATAETDESISAETSDSTETYSGTTEGTVITEPEPEKATHFLHVLLDNGHASSTPGKRSWVLEDGRQFFEYEFNRDVVKRIAKKLDAIGVPYEIITPEVDYDVPLRTRAQRANKFCDEYGTDNCIFISVHANAAGNGEWKTAKGFCCYTSKGETASDKYAELFMREAESALKPFGKTIKKYSSKKYSWEENFTVLVLTKCPAILTENLFYDNKEEVKFLLSDEGREVIAQYHVNTILKIEESLRK